LEDIFPKAQAFEWSEKLATVNVPKSSAKILPPKGQKYRLQHIVYSTASFLFSASGSGLILHRAIVVDLLSPFTRTSKSVATRLCATAATLEHSSSRRLCGPQELEMAQQDNNRICSKCAKDTSLRIASPCPIHNSLGEEIYQYPTHDLFLYAEVLAERSIRLIHIYDRSQDDRIRIKLEIASINTAKYKALSYVWGKDPSKKKTIVCGDYQLEIGENLYHALWQIREDGDTDVLWWVDAICINQANGAEKAEQVKMMKDIYQEATLVVSWLGPEKENDAAGFALLRTICEQLGDYSSSMAFMAGPPRLDDLQQLGLPAVEDPQWSWMTDILHRPYFYRVWIIQEIVVARACIVKSGTQRIDRSAVLAFGALLEKFENIKTAVLATLPPDDTEEMEEPTTEDVRWAMPYRRAFTAHDKAIRYLPVRELWLFYHGFQCGGLPIASLLLRTGIFEATDRRDKIFALVGLSTNLNPNLNPNFISYASSGSQIDIQMIQLQIEVARISMQESQTWGPLLFSYVNTTERSPQLPSWVPDWSTAGLYQSLVSYHIDEMSSFRQVCWEIKSNKVGIPLCSRNVHIPNTDLDYTFTRQDFRSCFKDRRTPAIYGHRDITSQHISRSAVHTRNESLVR